MITIGTRLKRKRLERGLSIEQVSDQVKIRIKYLSALEEGRYNRFASAVYAKGFLRNYASFLGIDPDKALALYRRECEVKKEAGLDDAHAPINEPRFVVTPGKIIIAAFVVMLMVLFGYFYYQYQQFAAPPFLDITSPRDGSDTIEETTTIEGVTEAGSIVTINDQAIKTDDLGNFKVTVSLKSGSNQIKIASENGIGKKSEKYVNVFLQTDDTIASADSDSGDDTVVADDTTDTEEYVYDGIEMEVKITSNSSWILIETDGEVAFTGVLVPDTVKIFKAAEKIYIKTGNAGSTNVTINGQLQESLGDEGEVESREYNKNVVLDISSSVETASQEE